MGQYMSLLDIVWPWGKPEPIAQIVHDANNQRAANAYNSFQARHAAQRGIETLLRTDGNLHTKPAKKTQCQTLIELLERGPVTSALAFTAGICSLHSRLNDVRKMLPPDKEITDKWIELDTRWGKSRIKAYSLTKKEPQ